MAIGDNAKIKVEKYAIFLLYINLHAINNEIRESILQNVEFNRIQVSLTPPDIQK
jgi:hypothetical protein